MKHGKGVWDPGLLLMCMHAPTHAEQITPTALQICFCVHVQVKCNVSSLPQRITGFGSLLLLDLQCNPKLHVNDGGEASLLGRTQSVNRRHNCSMRA